MTFNEQKKAAEIFIQKWTGRGNEKQDIQSFWNSLLRDIYGVKNPEDYITFEKQVYVKGKAKYIDGYIRNAHVIIEQKSLGINLLGAEQQSDGSLLTPFEQAWRYDGSLSFDEHCQWIITCNFQEFYIYDMRQEHRDSTPTYSFTLSELKKEFPKLDFLISHRDVNFVKEEKVSKDAGIIVGKLYDALLKQYSNPSDAETFKSLNALCVRLVFCLYAEDAGLFYTPTAFHDYLNSFNTPHIRLGLSELFNILNTEEDKRSSNIEEGLKQFPYVNGGLFENLEYEIPQFNEEIRHILIDEASAGFDWSEISPTIFGAVFESTLNQEKRRKGGMHYTSVEYIHRVIDHLFLDDLKAELHSINEFKQSHRRLQELRKFQTKLSTLTFLDPACGSGNFLTETYISLRKMENEVLRQIKDEKGLASGQMTLGGAASPIKVSLEQFYGIEIDDFAVTVATTALWISESQMIKETENIIDDSIRFFPLRSRANVHEADAVNSDWETLLGRKDISYIIGNPPFKGARDQSEEQKSSLLKLFEGVNNAWDLDFVTCWYKKAFDYMTSTTRGAFISTDSITSGVQPAILQKIMKEKKCQIEFAYEPFKWESESTKTAQVFCVIIGFSKGLGYSKKYIYNDAEARECTDINWTLRSESFVPEERKKPLCNVPEMVNGNMERGGVNLILEEEEMKDICKREPNLKKFIKPFYGTNELMGNKRRYCIWLVDTEYSEIVNSPILMDRVNKVKEHRLASKAKTTRGYATTPTLFAQRPQPENADFIIVPRVTSKAKYLPMAFMKSGNIVSDKAHLIPNATPYHFGILVSRLHELWTSEIGMRMGAGYSYSKELVYNTFPWPSPTDAQRKRIEETAQGIIDVRNKFLTSMTLKQMYSKLMPHELILAHEKNDAAVLRAYGFFETDENGKTVWFNEERCVTELMQLYAKTVKTQYRKHKETN